MDKNQYIFNAETCESTCVLYTSFGKFVGKAKCCDEYRDMLSEKTGLFIAESRARIKALAAIRDKIQSELSGLKKYYYAVSQSKHYNESKYMEHMLKRHIMRLEHDLFLLRNDHYSEKETLRQFIRDKGEFYTKIRKNRQANNG